MDCINWKPRNPGGRKPPSVPRPSLLSRLYALSAHATLREARGISGLDRLQGYLRSRPTRAKLIIENGLRTSLLGPFLSECFTTLSKGMLSSSGGASMSTAEKINRRFHRLGLLYASIPVLAGVYAAYEVATHGLQQQHAINWRDIFIDGVLRRLSLTLLIAFVVYCLLRVVGSIVLRLDRVSSVADTTLHVDYRKHVEREIRDTAVMDALET